MIRSCSAVERSASVRILSFAKHSSLLGTRQRSKNAKKWPRFEHGLKTMVEKWPARGKSDDAPAAGPSRVREGAKWCGSRTAHGGVARRASGGVRNCAIVERAECTTVSSGGVGWICASDAAACDAGFCERRNVAGAEGGYVRNRRRGFREIQNFHERCERGCGSGGRSLQACNL